VRIYIYTYLMYMCIWQTSGVVWNRHVCGSYLCVCVCVCVSGVVWNRHAVRAVWLIRTRRGGLHRLQCVAACCSVLLWVAVQLLRARRRGFQRSQCVAMCCSVLRCGSCEHKTEEAFTGALYNYAYTCYINVYINAYILIYCSRIDVL